MVFDGFLLFSHVLISLIKLIVWLKFPQTKDRQRTWGQGNDNRVLLLFRKTIALAIGTFFGKVMSLLLIYYLGLSFRHSSVSKESACDAGDQGSVLGSERSPGKGNGSPLQYSCLGNPMDRGAYQATVHEVTKVRHNLVTTPPPPGLS